MKRLVALLLAILLAAAQSESVLARGDRGSHAGRSAHRGTSSHGARIHHHARIGIFAAAPLWGPWYSPPWVDLRPGAEPSSPIEYIERDSAAASAAPPVYWYYCPEGQALYPEIDDCPGGWQELMSHPS